MATSLLPAPRGPLSAGLMSRLEQPPLADTSLVRAARTAVRAAGDDVLTDDDVQVSLYVLYELHYGGVAGVDDRWEWAPGLLAVRAVLEEALEGRLRRLAPSSVSGVGTRQDVVRLLERLVADDPGPSLAAHLERRGDLAQVRELLVHRSIYHLKEADPHTWAIPRLRGAPKAALVEIQADEYGGGRPEWMHSTLFAATLRALDLDDTVGAYVDAVPAVTLAHLNTMSLFGLHRRLRGAVAGHLAAFEMTSSLPNRRYGNALRRLGFDGAVTAYFDEHVEADAVHEQIASRDLAGALVEDDPRLLDDVLLGASSALALDGAVAVHLLDAWSGGRSSLRSGPAGAGKGRGGTRVRPAPARAGSNPSERLGEPVPATDPSVPATGARGRPGGEHRVLAESQRRGPGPVVAAVPPETRLFSVKG